MNEVVQSHIGHIIRCMDCGDYANSDFAPPQTPLSDLCNCFSPMMYWCDKCEAMLNDLPEVKKR